MKAAPVLLCLVLAHGIGANVFKHKDRLPDDLDFQQLKHIDIYQSQHRNQPSDNEWHHYQLHHQKPNQHNIHQDEEKQDQQRGRLMLSNKRIHEWENTREPQHKENWQISQDEQPSREMNYHQQLEQYNREKYPSYKQKKQNQRRLSSYSSESAQSSQESQERSHYNDNVMTKVNDEIYRWIPQTSAMTLQNQVTANSDVIENKVHIGVDSSISAQDKEELERIFNDAQKAMRQLSDDEQIQFHHAIEHAKQHSEDTEANVTQLVKKHEYPIEEHTVKTDDGYVLTLFRISPKIQPRIVFFKRPVVFLMHGIDGSADDWLLMGPKKSLPYLLADAGYDVWLGNARGNKYSKKHVSKHPALSEFWDFSIDQIALHDLPAMIDYTLEITKQKKLTYIGHSQGNTVFFALTAARPEYNDKINMMYALSPVVYMNNARSPLFRMMSPLSNFYKRLQNQLGNGPFTPNKEFIRAVGGAMLEAQTGCKNLSSNINFVMAGVNASVSDAQVMFVVMHHLPAGTSSKLIKHYGQAIASQEFRRYDYGPKINMNVYGEEQAPRYEIENVKAPVSLYYSEEDWLAHPKDVERLEKELPNVIASHKISEEHFSNMDFQFSSKAPEMVYKSIIDSIPKNH